VDPGWRTGGAAGARANPQGLNNYLMSAGAGRGAPRTSYLPGSGVLRWWARAEKGAAGARADPQGLNNYLMSAGAGRGAPRTGYLPGSGVLRWWARAEKGAAGARADPQGLNNYLISAGAGRGAPRRGYLPGSGVLRWWARAERGGEAPASPGGRPPGARQLNIFLSSTTIFEATPFIYPATLFHPPTCRSCFRRFGAVFFPNNALMCSFYTDPPIALLKVRVKHRKRDFVVGAIFRSGLRPRGGSHPAQDAPWGGGVRGP
jgi:hypothetical protein